MATITMLHSVSPDALSAMHGKMRDATQARIDYEMRDNGGEKTAKQMEKLPQMKGEKFHNPFALHYFAAHAFDYDAFINSHKRSGDRTNVYSLSKAETVASVLNGGSLPAISSNDAPTIAGCVLALKRGVCEGKALANALNDYMRGTLPGRADWQSGGTQSSSTMRALEALGVASRDGARAWKVANPDAFTLLLAASRKLK